MGLTAQAILDNQAITTNMDEWGVSMLLTAPTGETATVAGLHVKHHTQIDPSTNTPINSKKASVSINENALIASNPLYPIRITDTGSQHYQEVNFKDHLINVDDSTGIVKSYIAMGWFPDEKLGMIVIILEDYIAA